MAMADIERLLRDDPGEPSSKLRDAIVHELNNVLGTLKIEHWLLENSISSSDVEPPGGLLEPIAGVGRAMARLESLVASLRDGTRGED